MSVPPLIAGGATGALTVVANWGGNGEKETPAGVGITPPPPTKPPAPVFADGPQRGLIGPGPMDLRFTPFEVLAVLITVAVLNMVARDGETNWLEGALLLAVYAVLGLTIAGTAIE